MDSWWQLGEHSGYSGEELELGRITCPFCEERGNFDTARHAEKKKPNGAKTLNFDTLACGSCKGYVMCLWSAGSSGLHDYRVLPWPMRVEKHPEHWPADVGRFWLQAHRSLADENWGAAAVMARSALQAALRGQGAAGVNLKQEIADLASRGLLRPSSRSGRTRSASSGTTRPIRSLGRRRRTRRTPGTSPSSSTSCSSTCTRCRTGSRSTARGRQEAASAPRRRGSRERVSPDEADRRTVTGRRPQPPPLDNRPAPP